MFLEIGFIFNWPVVVLTWKTQSNARMSQEKWKSLDFLEGRRYRHGIAIVDITPDLSQNLCMYMFWGFWSLNGSQVPNMLYAETQLVGVTPSTAPVGFPGLSVQGPSKGLAACQKAKSASSKSCPQSAPVLTPGGTLVVPDLLLLSSNLTFAGPRSQNDRLQ